MEFPLAIVLFFVGHWTLSIFFQTFFLHRYGAHRMFTLSRFWERFFHLCTFLTQGSSYLNPRGYAILHRMHHAYSDTEKDPHSPVMFSNPFAMMNHTKDIYRGINVGTFPVEERFEGGYPDWPLLDRIAHRWLTSLCWGAAYAAFYLMFATQWWHFLLVPIHWLMGPVHGAIVNWFGHWAGYRNFENKDASRNTLIFDFVTMGELFQNNHHKYGMRPNFAVRWFEVDPTWTAIRIFAKLGILKLRDERLLMSKDEREATHVTEGLAATQPPEPAIADLGVAVAVVGEDLGRAPAPAAGLVAQAFSGEYSAQPEPAE